MTVSVDVSRLLADDGPKVTLAGPQQVLSAGTGTVYYGFSSLASVYIEASVQFVGSLYGRASLTLLVEHSDDGVTWTTAETFTYSGDNTQTATLTSPKNYMRASWTVGNNSEWYLRSVVAALGAAGGGSSGDAAPLAQSGQTPAQEPSPPGTANVGTLAVAARADLIIPSYGLFGWLGDGSDGAAIFDGSSTPAGVTKNSSTHYSATRDLHYTSAVISDTVTLDMAGWILFVRGSLTGPLTGAATVTGEVKLPTGANNNTASTAPDNNYRYAGGPTLGLGPGSYGASGGTGAGSQPGAGVDYHMLDRISYSPGAGGAGSAGAGAAGQNGTTNSGTYLTGRRFMVCTFGVCQGSFNSADSATRPHFLGGFAGGGGGGDSTNAGGAGGGGGNTVIVNAKVVTGIVNVTAPGGAGGAPVTGNCGGGGGGTGGVVFLNSLDLTGWTGAVSAAGGAGGAKVGTGVAGAAGAAGVARATTWV